ncbi:hypothetical protein GF357_01845 [Candidatus Dojkabacteria bacterium]|nr:hypothetical protein [Candidatus Dojkabacteria bacterium]
MQRISKYKSIRAYSGITLMEAILYLALFGLIFISIAQFFMFSVEQNQIARKKVQIEKSVLFIKGHLEDSFGQTVLMIPRRYLIQIPESYNYDRMVSTLNIR